MMKASAGSGRVATRSRPECSAWPTSASRSGSCRWSLPLVRACCTRGLGSTPTTVWPATANMAAVGRPTYPSPRTQTLSISGEPSAIGPPLTADGLASPDESDDQQHRCVGDEHQGLPQRLIHDEPAQARRRGQQGEADVHTRHLAMPES